MKVSVLKAIGLAAITALVCAGCTDDGASAGKEADMFLDRTDGTTYTLSTAIVPTGGGSVSRSPNKSQGYIPGERVTVTATASSNYVFTKWSGASDATTNPVNIEMDGSKALTANFTRTYTLTVSTNGSGSVSRYPTNSSGQNNGVYLDGTTVTVTATPSSDYYFTGWSGASSSTSSSIDITMNENKTLTANFKRKYTLTVSTNGCGSVSRSPTNSPNLNNGVYLDGTKVTVTATPSYDCAFTGWSGASSSTSSSVDITMNDNKMLTATFRPVYTLFTNVSPTAAGSISRNPTNSPSRSNGDYIEGTQVTLTVTGNPGYTFNGWLDGSSANPRTITVNSSQTLTANFKQDQYSLSLYVNPSNGGSVSPSHSGPYTYNTQVTVTASAANSSCYTFDRWSDGSTANPRPVTMTGPVSLTANFKLIQYTLTVSSTTGGSVSRSPNKTSYDCGENVTVTATPSSNYEFKGWSDGSSANPRTITMNSSQTLTPNFQRASYTVEYDANGGVWTSPGDPSGVQKSVGEAIPLPANLSRNGYSFAGWDTDDGVRYTTYYVINGSDAYRGTITLTAKWTYIGP